MLLRGDEDYVLPSWAHSLQFDHQLHCPWGAPASGPPPPSPSHLLRVGSLTLNTRSGELQAGARTIQLTPRECRLLGVFLSRPNEVLNKEELM